MTAALWMKSQRSIVRSWSRDDHGCGYDYDCDCDYDYDSPIAVIYLFSVCVRVDEALPVLLNFA